MSARSWLFVPGDAERKLEKALAGEADALILDLEDSVAAARLPVARGLVAAALRAHPGPRMWVRINALTRPEALADLAAVMPAAPAGIMLPKAEGAADLRRLDHFLSALEAAFGLVVGTTRILVIATETPAALFALGDYARVSPRLAALTWGAEDLAAALGASSNRAVDGGYADPYRLARSLCLAGAVAAGAEPLDSVFTDFRDGAGLAQEAAAARRDGFTGKLAIHPDQIGPINAAFTPTAEEVAHAEQIVAAFAADPTLGAVGIGGRMIDRPHLVQAQRLLARRPAPAA